MKLHDRKSVKKVSKSTSCSPTGVCSMDFDQNCIHFASCSPTGVSPWISMMSILTIRIFWTFDSKYPHFWILDWCGYLLLFIRVVLFGFYEVVWIFWCIYSFMRTYLGKYDRASLLLNSLDWWILMLFMLVFSLMVSDAVKQRRLRKFSFGICAKVKKSKMWEKFLLKT